MISPLTTTRLRKAATDNGFDIEQAPLGLWLSFLSTKVPLKIWLTGNDGNALTVALSQSSVAGELGAYCSPSMLEPPANAVAVGEVPNLDKLYPLLRRAFQLSRTLPNELLHEFHESASGLPTTTEAERLVVQRLGQDIYRRGLIAYWEGRCAITGLDVVELLRASHSKPWAECADDAERLDVYNGLLLAPQLDAMFDRGFITASDDGCVLFSARLSMSARELLGLHENMRVERLTDAHRKYLRWHAERVFV